MASFITAQQREKLIELYIGYFNRAPEAAGLSYWAGQLLATLNAGQSEAQAFAGIANRFYDAGVQFGVYSSAMTVEQFITTVYQNVLGRDQVDAAGMTYWKTKLQNGGVSRGEFVMQLIQEAKNYVANAPANDPYKWVGTYLENRKAVGDWFANNSTGLTGNDAITKGTQVLQTAVTKATAQAGQTTTQAVAAAQTANQSAQGQTFMLTASVDTITGTSGNDTINAPLVVDVTKGTATLPSLTSFDAIDGGAGTDTLNIFLTGDQSKFSTSATVKNVETINFNVDDKLTADVSAWGGNAVNVTQVGTAAAQSVTVGAASVSVKGGSTVAVTDGTTNANVLTTVSVDGNTGQATLTGKAIATVSLANTKQDADVVNATASGKGALILNVNNVTGGAKITDTKDNYSTVTVNATGKASDIAVKSNTAGTLTAATLGGDAALTFATNSTKLAAVTITGSGGVTADFSAAGTTSVDASASSGANSITLDGTKSTYKGGSGADTVLLAAAPTKAIDGGAGANTLSLDAIADLTTLTKTSLANATNFQTIQLTGAVGTAKDAGKSTLDVANLPAGMVNVTLNTTTDAENLTFKNVASGFNFTQLASQAKSSTITLAKDGSADVLNLTIGNGKSATIDLTTGGGIVATKFETVNITANADTSKAAVQHKLTIDASGATTLNVTGDAGINFTGSTLTAVTTVAGGASKGDLVIDLTGGVTTGVTVTTGSGADTITTVGAAGKVDTINSGTGNDTIKVGDGNNVIVAGGGDTKTGVTITAGKGDNTITVNGSGISTITAGDGKNAITGGAGADTVTVGNGNNTINAGAGDDSITVGKGANTLTLGAGKDTVVFKAAASSSAVFTTITDIAAGDKLDFSKLGDITNTDGKLGAALTSGVNDYQTFLNAAAGKAVGTLSWFQFGGDTYLVWEKAGNGTFDAGTDQIVKLVGLVDLSNSTTAQATDTLTIV